MQTRGRDSRALVAGGGSGGDARGRISASPLNIHRGGHGTGIELDARYTRVAVQSARIMGLDIAGVDMLESSTGPKVIEINASPGFEGLEAATGDDVAAHFIRVAERHAARRAGSLGD